MTAGFLAAVTLISSFGTIDVSAASLDMSEQSETDYDLMGSIWTGSGEVWSEPEYDGWQLTWSAGIFYDRLDRIEKDGIIYIYSYDMHGCICCFDSSSQNIYICNGGLYYKIYFYDLSGYGCICYYIELEDIISDC